MDRTRSIYGANEGGEAATVDQLCWLLGGWFGSGRESALTGEIDWANILDLSEKTKTSGLLSFGCEARGVTMPGFVAQRLAILQDIAGQRNAANMAWSVRIDKAMERAGILAVFLKGPAHTQEVYGSIDKRLSNDVDVIVPKRDYEAAGQVLAEVGYMPLVSSADRWWHVHLNESPYGHREGIGPVVDLHNDLQQPGGPFLWKLDEFLTSHVFLKLGGNSVRVPSPHYSLLLTAINLGKAVRSRAPWVSYAHELCMAVDRHGHEGIEEVRTLARENGVLRLLDDSLERSEILFGGRGVVERDDLLMSAIGHSDEGLFFRTRQLWDWTDGKPLARVINFIAGLQRVARFEISGFTRKFGT